MCIKTHLLEEPKFLTVRRRDISQETRVKIGFLLNYYPRHGLATELANRYKVSRPFVYTQKAKIKDFFSEDLEAKKSEENIRNLLLYRIRGGLSISKCSDFLSADSLSNTSVGWISEQIKYLGDLVGNVVDWEGQVVFASDEIYLAGDIPVLVSVDPLSSAILSITACNQLSSESWQNHWSALESKKIRPISIVGDEGKSLRAAHKELKDITYQPDTFHAITQRFGKVRSSLEKQATRCISQEYERERVYLNAKSDKVKARQLQNYQKAQTATEKALNLLSDFNWLYGHLNRQLKPVRSDGSIRLKSYAKSEVQAVLELMEETLDIDLDKQIKAVRNLLPELFTYLDQAKKVYQLLEKQVCQSVLPFFLAYWQYNRELNNLKKHKDKRRFTKSKLWLIQIMEEYQKMNPIKFQAEKKLVFAAMQGVIQSSAMVECINSILRPIFNESKGQVSQETLNLVMYWHNHRVFKRGKRKGKSPIELLTGKKVVTEWTKDIIELAKTKMAA